MTISPIKTLPGVRSDGTDLESVGAALEEHKNNDEDPGVEAGLST